MNPMNSLLPALRDSLVNGLINRIRVHRVLLRDGVCHQHAALKAHFLFCVESMAGISVFATGGIGGVHRGAETTMDISADLEELGQTPVMVICAGAKSSAVSTFFGYGIPWEMMVDSKATTGLPEANASETSAEISRYLFIFRFQRKIKFPRSN